MITLIVNPAAGAGRAARTLDAVGAELQRRRLRYEVAPTRDVEHARDLAAAAGASGETVVALGGDGLVRALADALRGTDAVLGILPAGRGNDLARVLGIPLDAVAACEVLASGAPRVLDLGEAAARAFVSIASCGFDSEVNRIANRTRVVRGRAVYAYAALRALLSWRPQRFELVVDGAARSLQAITVAIANSAAYGGGMLMAPGARLDDGLLDVVVIAEASRLRFLRSLPLVFQGTHVDLPYVSVVRAREVAVACERPLTMYADGDPIGQLPVTVRCVPGAIRVMAPSR